MPLCTPGHGVPRLGAKPWTLAWEGIQSLPSYSKYHPNKEANKMPPKAPPIMTTERSQDVKDTNMENASSNADGVWFRETLQ